MSFYSLLKKHLLSIGLKKSCFHVYIKSDKMCTKKKCSPTPSFSFMLVNFLFFSSNKLSKSGVPKYNLIYKLI